MTNILISSIYLVGIVELFFAFYFFITRSGNEVRKVMSGFALFTSMWVLASAAISYTTESSWTIFLIRIIFVAGIFLLSALVNLILVYPFKILATNRLFYTLFYLPAFIFSAIAVFTNAIVERFAVNPSIAGVIYPGPVYEIYNSFLILLFLVAIALTIYRIKHSDGTHKKNLRLLFFGILIAGTPGVYFSLVEEFLGKSTNDGSLYGNLSTIVWFGIAVYIVLKK